jgi:hypothetical protein
VTTSAASPRAAGGISAGRLRASPVITWPVPGAPLRRA